MCTTLIMTGVLVNSKEPVDQGEPDEGEIGELGEGSDEGEWLLGFLLDSWLTVLWLGQQETSSA